MDEYKIVWQISTDLSDSTMKLVGFIGFGIFFIIVGLVQFKKQKDDEKTALKEVFGPYFAVFLGILSIIFPLRGSLDTIRYHRELINAFKNNQYKTVEGDVIVKHVQRFECHEGGDIIVVDGETFEVNFCSGKPGYNISISHGGVLDDGVHARIKHYDNQILSIELKDVDIKQQPEIKKEINANKPLALRAGYSAPCL